jgi:hypothetical protein
MPAGATVALIKRADPDSNGGKLAKSLYDAFEKAGFHSTAAATTRNRSAVRGSAG